VTLVPTLKDSIKRELYIHQAIKLHNFIIKRSQITKSKLNTSQDTQVMIHHSLYQAIQDTKFNQTTADKKFKDRYLQSKWYRQKRPSERPISSIKHGVILRELTRNKIVTSDAKRSPLPISLSFALLCCHISTRNGNKDKSVKEGNMPL
jgi:hypothetical protein